MLQPVFSCPDPLRGGDNKLVMCEVLLPDMTPHATNTRAALRPIAEKYASQEPLFGIEQEYTFFKDGRPHGFPEAGFPAPQGFYYCGIGADEVFGRDVVEAHLDACLEAGLGDLGHQRRGDARSVGVPGRSALAARGLRPALGGALAAVPHRRGLRHRGDPRPEAGEGRLERRRRAHQLLDEGDARERTSRSSRRARRSSKRAAEHVEHYGAEIEHRLTGLHETAPWNEFSYGVSDRGASVRIPWQVEIDGRATSRTGVRTPTWIRTS